MMFAVLFGLSINCQVFLISQINGAARDPRHDRDAIRRGLASGARVIVAAALIMMSVFGSFVLNADPTVKQFGVGLSVGVALAAVCVLVFSPAFLVLAGRGGLGGSPPGSTAPCPASTSRAQAHRPRRCRRTQPPPP